MTNFETEVYNRSGEDVIGARVIVSADNGQTIDSIQVTNKTQFDEIKSKLDTLNEDYTQFDDGSPLAGKSIDTILKNTDESANINATKLGGIASDGYAKTSHNHRKSAITDLYNYDISLSKYNLNMCPPYPPSSTSFTDNKTTVTVKVTNMSNSPVGSHQVLIYKNGALWKTGYTNQNGVFSTTYTAETEGLITFQVNNQKVQCNVIYDSGWTEVIPEAFFSGSLRVRRIGKTVHIQGDLKADSNIQDVPVTIDGISSYVTIADLGYDGLYNSNAFRPSKNEIFVCQTSGLERCMVSVEPNGAIKVGRFTNSNSQYKYTIKNNQWFPLSLTYFVD